MKISLKIITPEKEIESKILQSIVNHINNKINPTVIQGIESKARGLIKEALQNSEGAAEIISGSLREELGITNPASSLNQIFDAISSVTEVKFTPASLKSKSVSMKITLSAIPFDLSDYNPIGSYVTEKGTNIPWFEWLTTLGDRVIVREYDVESGHPRHSRTGNMIMVNKGKSGWRVPPHFSGTHEDNFVTRAVDQILPELGKIIERTIKARL